MANTTPFYVSMTKAEYNALSEAENIIDSHEASEAEQATAKLNRQALQERLNIPANSRVNGYKNGEALIHKLS